jgi:hypothetical protein
MTWNLQYLSSSTLAFSPQSSQIAGPTSFLFSLPFISSLLELFFIADLPSSLVPSFPLTIHSSSKPRPRQYFNPYYFFSQKSQLCLHTSAMSWNLRRWLRDILGSGVDEEGRRILRLIRHSVRVLRCRMDLWWWLGPCWRGLNDDGGEWDKRNELMQKDRGW